MFLVISVFFFPFVQCLVKSLAQIFVGLFALSWDYFKGICIYLSVMYLTFVLYRLENDCESHSGEVE